MEMIRASLYIPQGPGSVTGGGGGTAPSNHPKTPKQACVDNAAAAMNQKVAGVQADHNKNLVVGVVGGVVTGAIQNCLTGAFVGAAVPLTFGQVELSPATGLAGCGANLFNPGGLVLGALQGAAASIGYDIFQVQQAKQEYAKQVNSVCSQLPG